MNNLELYMPIEYARMSNTIKNILDDIEDEDDADAPVIPVEKINYEIMKKVKDFCAKYAKDAKDPNAPNAPIDLTEEEEEKQDFEIRTRPLTEFERTYTKVPKKILFEMINTANYLDLKPMLDVCCKAVAEMIKEKTSDEIKNEFKIEFDYDYKKEFDVTGDFSQEDKEQVTKENPWLKDPDADADE